MRTRIDSGSDTERRNFLRGNAKLVKEFRRISCDIHVEVFAGGGKNHVIFSDIDTDEAIWIQSFNTLSLAIDCVNKQFHPNFDN